MAQTKKTDDEPVKTVASPKELEFEQDRIARIAKAVETYGPTRIGYDTIQSILDEKYEKDS